MHLNQRKQQENLIKRNKNSGERGYDLILLLGGGQI